MHLAVFFLGHDGTGDVSQEHVAHLTTVAAAARSFAYDFDLLKCSITASLFCVLRGFIGHVYSPFALYVQ